MMCLVKASGTCEREVEFGLYYGGFWMVVVCLFGYRKLFKCV